MDAPAHYFLTPSGAPIWAHCSAAPQYAALYPQLEDNDDAREGTAVHELNALRIHNHVIGATASNGIAYTDVMRDASDEWIDTVQAILRRHPDAVLYVEQQFRIARIHPTLCGGTPDAFIYSPSKRKLWVLDFKYGFAFVEVVDNWQLTTYLSGVLDVLGINGYDEQYVSVEFVIVQPRSFGHGGSVRKWNVSSATYFRPMWTQLQQRAAEATAPNPVATSGEHCFYCPGRHVCPAGTRMAYKAIDYASRAQPLQMTPQTVSFELNVLERAQDAIKARLIAVTEQAKQFIRAGKVVDGYTLEPTFGNLAWTRDIAEIKALGDAYGVPLVKEKPITPTQAKDKGIDDFVINSYAAKPANGVKLKRVDTAVIRRIISNHSTE